MIRRKGSAPRAAAQGARLHKVVIVKDVVVRRRVDVLEGLGGAELGLVRGLRYVSFKDRAWKLCDRTCHGADTSTEALHSARALATMTT